MPIPPFLSQEFEQDELEEFELLEQFAEDDASFMSSVSAVDKVLQKKKVVFLLRLASI